MPRFPQLVKLAKALGVTLEELVSGSSLTLEERLGRALTDIA